MERRQGPVRGAVEPGVTVPGWCSTWNIERRQRESKTREPTGDGLSQVRGSWHPPESSPTALERRISAVNTNPQRRPRCDLRRAGPFGSGCWVRVRRHWKRPLGTLPPADRRRSLASWMDPEVAAAHALGFVSFDWFVDDVPRGTSIRCRPAITSQLDLGGAEPLARQLDKWGREPERLGRRAKPENSSSRCEAGSNDAQRSRRRAPL